MATVAVGVGCALALYALKRWKTRQAQEEEDVAHTVKPDDSSPESSAPPIPPRTKTYADAVKQTKEEKIQENIEEQKEETKKTTDTQFDCEV